MRSRSIVVLGAGALVPLAAVATSCGDDGPGDTARFCGEVQEHLAALTASPATVDDIDGFLDLYREVGDAAPLAIEPHWQALVRSYETASTVEPADPESVEAAVAQAYASEESAVAVRDFLLTQCALDMGPISTIVAHGPVQPAGAAPTTTQPAG